MYDTDKYKNYMSMIPQSWLGKAKAAGLMGMGGIQIGAMGNTDSRPTPDWYPKNLQKESYRGNLLNAEMPDWYDKPKFYPTVGLDNSQGRGPSPFRKTTMWNPSINSDDGSPNLYGYGSGGLPLDIATGDRITENPYKLQSIGSNERGQTMYEVEPNEENPDSWRILWNHFGPSYAPAIDHFFGGSGVEQGGGRGRNYTPSGGKISSPGGGRYKQPKVDITSVSGGRGGR